MRGFCTEHATSMEKAWIAKTKAASLLLLLLFLLCYKSAFGFCGFVCCTVSLVFVCHALHVSLDHSAWAVLWVQGPTLPETALRAYVFCTSRRRETYQARQTDRRSRSRIISGQINHARVIAWYRAWYACVDSAVAKPSQLATDSTLHSSRVFVKLLVALKHEPISLHTNQGGGKLCLVWVFIRLLNEINAFHNRDQRELYLSYFKYIYTSLSHVLNVLE